MKNRNMCKKLFETTLVKMSSTQVHQQASKFISSNEVIVHTSYHFKICSLLHNNHTKKRILS